MKLSSILVSVDLGAACADRVQLAAGLAARHEARLVGLAACPVPVIAPPGLERLVPRRVVVAWKDTREARRAVHDALPLLAGAERVSIVAVGPDAHRGGAEARPGTCPATASRRPPTCWRARP